MSENWLQSEVCTVINDKSQNSTAKHLSCDGLLYYTTIFYGTAEGQTFGYQVFLTTQFTLFNARFYGNDSRKSVNVSR